MQLSRYVLSHKLDSGTVYFNTKNNHSFFITKELEEVISHNKEIARDYYSYLEQNMYCSEENEVDKYLQQIQDTNNEVLEFTILTHGDCNFRCKYCYEHFENIGMSEKTELAILKFAEEKLKTGVYRYLRISWFGGEPLLGYVTIQRLSTKFLELCDQFDVIYSASITTNGFLLTSKKFEALVSDYHVSSFQITLDGDCESHDTQRVLKNKKGSYLRILENLHRMKETPLNFTCVLRFNVSKENYNHMELFLLNDGEFFKGDDRFLVMYHNIGNWGQGDRSRDDCVTLLKDDASYELSIRALNLGYKLCSPNIVIHNSFSCYANRLNHYMFNVKGIVQSCTVALYNKENIFGNINTGLINQNKLKNWSIMVRDDCKGCPFVLVCKSGFCPMAKHITKLNSDFICESMKERIKKNLALFALSKLYEDILDVD